LSRANFPTSGQIIQGPEGYVYGWGKTVGNGVQGWAYGALFVHTDGSGGSQTLYVNTNTSTSATWSKYSEAALSGTMAITNPQWTFSGSGLIALGDTIPLYIGTGAEFAIQQRGTPNYVECGPVGECFINAPSKMMSNYEQLVHEIYDDFLLHTDGTTTHVDAEPWDLTATLDGTFAINADTLGGTATMTNKAATDNNATQIEHIQKSFKLAATKDLWFATRFRCAAGDATNLDLVIGMVAGEDLTAVADNRANDGIHIFKNDGSTTVQFGCSMDDQDGTPDTNIGTLGTGWHTVEFFVEGVSTSTVWFDGVSGGSLSSTNDFFPTDENLTPTFMIRNGDGVTQQTLEIDYVKVLQLR